MNSPISFRSFSLEEILEELILEMRQHGETKFQSAVELFDKTNPFDPQYVKMACVVGCRYLYSGNETLGLKYLRDLEDADKILSKYEEMNELEDEADASFIMDRVEEGIATVKKAILIEPGNLSFVSRLFYKMCFNLYKNKMFKEVIEKSNTGIVVFKTVPLLAIRGMAKFMLNKVFEAKKDFGLCKKLDSDFKIESAIDGCEKEKRYPRMHDKSYYEILGVGENASHDEIRNVYEVLTRKSIPDTIKEGEIQKKKYELYGKAKDVLLDPVKKKTYNRQIFNSDICKRNGYLYKFNISYTKVQERKKVSVKRIVNNGQYQRKNGREIGNGPYLQRRYGRKKKQAKRHKFPKKIKSRQQMYKVNMKKSEIVDDDHPIEIFDDFYTDNNINFHNNVIKKVVSEYRGFEVVKSFEEPKDIENYLKIVCLGDTHFRGKNGEYVFPEVPIDGDVLIFCGDYSNYLEWQLIKDDENSNEEKLHFKGIKIPESVVKFNECLGELPPSYKKKYVIAGNHDFTNTTVDIKLSTGKIVQMNINLISPEEIQEKILTNCKYLQETFDVLDVKKCFPKKSTKNKRFIKIFGTPFHKHRKANLYHRVIKKNPKIKDKHLDTISFGVVNDKERFNRIPEDTNILITHVPPYGILDYAQKTDYEKNVLLDEFRSIGNKNLLNRVKELKNLRMHCFGHVHNSKQQGVYIDKETNVAFVQSACDLNVSKELKPIVYYFKL